MITFTQQYDEEMRAERGGYDDYMTEAYGNEIDGYYESCCYAMESIEQIANPVERAAAEQDLKAEMDAYYRVPMTNQQIEDKILNEMFKNDKY